MPDDILKQSDVSTKATHTPGPWFVFAGREGIFNNCDVIVSAHVEDAIVCAMGHDMPEIASNARLIAAAPELLAALKAVTEHMDRAGGDAYAMPECPWCKAGPDGDHHGSDCELVAARAAIAKAEGRSA